MSFLHHHWPATAALDEYLRSQAPSALPALTPRSSSLFSLPVLDSKSDGSDDDLPASRPSRAAAPPPTPIDLAEVKSTMAKQFRHSPETGFSRQAIVTINSGTSDDDISSMKDDGVFDNDLLEQLDEPDWMDRRKWRKENVRLSTRRAATTSARAASRLQSFLDEYRDGLESSWFRSAQSNSDLLADSDAELSDPDAIEGVWRARRHHERHHRRPVRRTKRWAPSPIPNLPPDPTLLSEPAFSPLSSDS